MSHSTVNPPRTIMEAFQSLPEGTLAELIEGAIYMSPSPTSRHQKVLKTILTKLDNHLLENEMGEILPAPIDVYLDENSNAVQPDIVVILSDNLSIINPKGHIHGIPDLLIEILSHGNKDHDLVKKKDLYEKFGVKEYCVVDPENKRTLGYFLENKKYQLRHEAIGLFTSRLLDFEFQF